ncbi:MAG: trypsin-like peptidase domain-containing protein [Promethearchaeati archaeon SRVP18_Atabeyarchaeia-1]
MSNAISSIEILRSLSDATVDVISKVSPSVVSVQSGMGGGTGVVWSSDGYIVTANHVMHRAHSVKVGLGDGGQIDAKVVGRDPYTDVALLKIDGNEFTSVELGDSDEIKVGEFVLALANAFNRQPAATSGIVTSVRSPLRGMRGMSMENAIVTDARLNPGYSGGPLIDASGRMVGMNTAFAWGRGIAIPINTIKNVVERLMKGGEVKRAFLGILMNPIPIPSEVTKETKIDQDRGLMVLQIEPGSPAKKAGIAFGDIIVRATDKPIRDIPDLTQLLSEDMIGKKSKFVVLRGEKLVELTVSPTAAPTEENP